MKPITPLLASDKLLFSDVQAAFDDGMLLADRNVVRLLAATVIANQIPGNPVWFMIVAGSSSGKTILMMSLDELELEPGKVNTTFISDLTENTFASGFKTSTGSASLLENMPYGGMMLFKDFTSIISKRTESQSVIMSQLREIYDRKFDKRTGNQNDTVWRGKVGAIAGVTQAIYEYMSSMSVMGDRFMMYSPVKPPRKSIQRFMADLRFEGKDQETILNRSKEYMHRYLRGCMPYVKDAKLHISKEDSNHLIDVTDFVTIARSGVFEDFKTGSVAFAPDPEEGGRIYDQLTMLAMALSIMKEHDGFDPVLTKDEMLPLYKVAFDSIPIKRMWALKQLASHAYGASANGIATVLGYDTHIVQKWLGHLSALGICTRAKGIGSSGDLYHLSPNYVNIMVTYQNVEVKQELLSGDGESNDIF